MKIEQMLHLLNEIDCMEKCKVKKHTICACMEMVVAFFGLKFVLDVMEDFGFRRLEKYIKVKEFAR